MELIRRKEQTADEVFSKARIRLISALDDMIPAIGFKVIGDADYLDILVHDRIIRISNEDVEDLLILSKAASDIIMVKSTQDAGNAIILLNLYIAFRLKTSKLSAHQIMEAIEQSECFYLKQKETLELIKYSLESDAEEDFDSVDKLAEYINNAMRHVG